MSLEHLRALVGKASEKVDRRGVEASRDVQKDKVVAVEKVKELMVADVESLKLGRD